MSEFEALSRRQPPTEPTFGVDAPLRVGVVVPARNEEASIGACLASLDLAARVARVPLVIVVVLDACNDGTSSAVRAAAAELSGELHVVEVSARRVGTARGAGITRLLEILGAGDVWLSTTDADSVVPADWFVRQLGYRDGGASVVVGTVHVDDWQDRIQLRPHWEHAYVSGRQPRVDGHRHVHGANLSFSAASYLRVGGFANVASDEDVQLVHAMHAAGESVVWASDLSVATSARRTGRAPFGFASYLNQLAHTVEAAGPGLEPT